MVDDVWGSPTKAEPTQSPVSNSGIGELRMHYDECLLWVQALEWFIRENGLKVPTWAGMTELGRKSTPKEVL